LLPTRTRYQKSSIFQIRKSCVFGDNFRFRREIQSKMTAIDAFSLSAFFDKIFIDLDDGMSRIKHTSPTKIQIHTHLNKKNKIGIPFFGG